MSTITEQTMNFGLDDEQTAIHNLIEQILSDQVEPPNLKAIEAGDHWLHTGAWNALAEAQLLGLAVPEADGGAGLGLIEVYLMLIQVGRHVAPVPVLDSILGTALTIAQAGSAAQKRQWLPGLLDGTTIAPVAMHEPNAHARTPLQTRAEPSGDGWVLNGCKTCVSFASVAHAFLIPAQTAQGIALFWLDRETDGLEISSNQITTEERVGELTLRDVKIDAPAKIDDSNGDAYTQLCQRYDLGLCALELGAAEKALEMTAVYARERKQFGVTICSFQAVAQRAGDAFINVEALRLAFWQAAWRLSADEPSSREIDVAKYWACEAGYFTVASAQHLHGGMGFDRDYPLFRYYLLSRKNEVLLGGASAQLAHLGDALADSSNIADHF